MTWSNPHYKYNNMNNNISFIIHIVKFRPHSFDTDKQSVKQKCRYFMS